MMRWNPWIGGLLAVTAGLVGCAPKTDVSTTANVPAAYSHVYMSVKEIWFNTSASAGPDDTTWKKYPLKTPTTVDLTSSLGGTVSSLITGLNVPIGTYAQVRLLPVDSSETLLKSAPAGVKYNSEVDYTDSAGTPQQVPLELLNPDKGLGVTANVQVKGATTAVLSSSSSTSSSSTTRTSSTNTTSTGTKPAPTFKLAINVDGAKDLVPFTYSDVSGMLLNPHIVAYDQAASGGISGTLDVSNLTGLTSPSTSAYLNIQVTAESLSADGTRHIAVNSAPVKSSDGTFTVYPLSTSSSSPTSYDLVIHGPGIATIIVKAVPVKVGDPSSTTPVNIGTITPQAATSFTVNLDTTNPLPAGTLVGFYQTLPGSSEVPYLIDAQPIDPFSRAFSTDQAQSTGSIYYATFVSGSNVNPNSTAPTEGAATYRVAGTAPLFSDGALTTTVTGPTSSTSTATLIAVPTLAAASGAILDTIPVTISKTSSTKYNKGELIFSRDGAVVQTAALDSILTQTANGTLTISGLPGGSAAGQFADGLYYVSVRVWNTSDPATTVVREIYPKPLDLRRGALSAYQLNID
jgi:hypothetical protein